MEMSQEIHLLAAALAKAQGAMANVLADQTAKIEMKAGGQFSYSYADLASVLEAIRKPLSDNGLSIIQGVDRDAGAVVIATQLNHASGQWVRAQLSMPIPDNLTPQNIGKAITYGRRYGLSALIGIAAEDDDGKAASEEKQAPRPQAPKPAREIKELPKAEVKAETILPRKDEPTANPAAERKHRMGEAALKRWPKEKSADILGEMVQYWLEQNHYPIWAAMTPAQQEEAIIKLREEAEIA